MHVGNVRPDRSHSETITRSEYISSSNMYTDQQQQQQQKKPKKTTGIGLFQTPTPTKKSVSVVGTSRVCYI